MIKISDSLTVNSPRSYLDKKAQELWGYLNPKVVSGSRYKNSSIVKKLEKALVDSDGLSYKKEYAFGYPTYVKRHKRFYRFLLKNDCSNLKRIIKGRPQELERVSKEIMAILRPADLYFSDGGSVSQTDFGKLLSGNIFNYKSYRQSNKCNAIFSDLGFDSSTCPYCNENRLSIVDATPPIKKADLKKALLDVDHFKPKSKYPFLALSFYNLLPSCHVCNSNYKGNADFTHLTHVHPHVTAFDDVYEFDVSPGVLLGRGAKEIYVRKKRGRRDGSLSSLGIVERYQAHIDEIEGIVNYFNKYNGDPNRQMFIDAILDNGKTPKRKADILKTERGKLKRDILRNIDEKNILGIE